MLKCDMTVSVTNCCKSLSCYSQLKKTKNFVLQNELRETKLERDSLVSKEEKRKEILQKTEEDFNSCLDDKASLEESARNISGTGTSYEYLTFGISLPKIIDDLKFY